MEYEYSYTISMERAGMHPRCQGLLAGMLSYFFFSCDLSADTGRAYVHCTAGLGRAPGIAIGYLHWFHDDDKFRDLDYSYEFLTSKRPCGPKK